MNPLLLALALLAPTTEPPDEPPIIVGVAIAELLIQADSTEADGGICGAYSVTAGVAAEIGQAADILLEGSQALVIITIEENNNVRFDDEARDVIRDWLESDCS